mgnify:CR=1 FL=1
MVQFYFLSILFNILAGLILVYGRNLTVSESADYSFSDDFDSDEDKDLFSDDAESKPEEAKQSAFKDFEGFNGLTFRLVLGVLCVFVGLMKLLSSYNIAFIGDIIPAFAGFLGGASLLIEYYAASSDNTAAIPVNVQNVFIDSRKYIGVFCLVAGVLHFICPRVLFL